MCGQSRNLFFFHQREAHSCLCLCNVWKCMDKRDTAGCTIVSGSGNIPDRLGTAFPAVGNRIPSRWEQRSRYNGKSTQV